jgi:hypothetical protein
MRASSDVLVWLYLDLADSSLFLAASSKQRSNQVARFHQFFTTSASPKR